MDDDDVLWLPVPEDESLWIAEMSSPDDELAIISADPGAAAFVNKKVEDAVEVFAGESQFWKKSMSVLEGGD